VPADADAVPAGSDGLLVGDGWSGGDGLPRLGNQVPPCGYAVPSRADEVFREWYPGSDGLPGLGNQVPAYGHPLSGGGYQVPSDADQVPACGNRLRPDSGGNRLSACGYQLQRLTGCYDVPAGGDAVPAGTNRLQQCDGWSGGDGLPGVSDEVSGAADQVS
jgi:hypothetical protein